MSKNDQSLKDEYAAALVDLTTALIDWKDNRGDALNVVGAIQRFVHAQLAQYDAIRSAK